jgi:rSAM/selenodomain-associated transferase 2
VRTVDRDHRDPVWPLSNHRPLRTITRVSARGLSISVIIPALNEQLEIERALTSTRAPGVERIVVDGGSTDGTAETARFLAADRVLEAPPGRARQIRSGYRAAKGDVILILHADSRLEEGWDAAVRRALGDAAVAGGAFRLGFESERLPYRLLERAVQLRSGLGRLPYGDQALFARREVLEAEGGVPPVPIFEDLDLVGMIRRSGRLVCLPQTVWTSARRYERNGVLRTVLRNNLALAAYGLGLPRDAVARWYRRRPRG